RAGPRARRRRPAASSSADPSREASRSCRGPSTRRCARRTPRRPCSRSRAPRAARFPQSAGTTHRQPRPRTVQASEAAGTLESVAVENPEFQAYSGLEPPQFANEAELECAKILDYYRVPWAYEPRTFVLEEDERGR